MYASIKYVCARYGFISIIEGTYQIEGWEVKAVQPWVELETCYSLGYCIALCYWFKSSMLGFCQWCTLCTYYLTRAGNWPSWWWNLLLLRQSSQMEPKSSSYMPKLYHTFLSEGETGPWFCFISCDKQIWGYSALWLQFTLISFFMQVVYLLIVSILSGGDL